MWITRLLSRVVGGRTVQSAGAVPAHKPACKAAERSVVLCDATRARLREGFRSNSSAYERSARPLTAIPVTHAAPPPVQSQRGIGQGSTTQTPSPAPSNAPPAKPRGPAGSAASTESVLSGAVWTTAVPPGHGLLNPVGEAPLLGLAPTSDAPSPLVFGELPGTAAPDLSPAPPLSLMSADATSVDILGGAPSWSCSTVLWRD